MAKLVIGTSKQTVVPAVVRDMSPTHYLNFSVDENGKLYKAAPFLDFTGVKVIQESNGLSYAAAFNSIFSVINFGDVENLYGGSCLSSFAVGSQLKEVYFPKLKTIEGINALASAFYNIDLEKAEFPVLETITANSVFNNAFYNNKLTSISFPKLYVIGGKFNDGSYNAPFSGCRFLGSVSFGGVKASTFSGTKNQLQYLFNSSTGSTATGGCTVHFPSNFDPADPNHTFDASTLSGYPTFGGNASYIHLAYDLPATE